MCGEYKSNESFSGKGHRLGKFSIEVQKFEGFQAL